MSQHFFDSPDVTLLPKKGQEVSAEDALRGKKYVLVYFSAHWCPPCRSFTPQLKKFYEQYSSSKDFEVVFVSLDGSEREAITYFEQHHGDWLRMSFESACQLKQSWGRQYGIQSIPSLLIFENTKPRRLVAKRGREMVVRDVSGERFPWEGADAEVQSSITPALWRFLPMLFGACLIWYMLR